MSEEYQQPRREGVRAVKVPQPATLLRALALEIVLFNFFLASVNVA
jgi:hypothetical protein